MIIGAVWALMNPVVTPPALLWYGQAANIPMILLGKLCFIFFSFFKL